MMLFFPVDVFTISAAAVDDAVPNLFAVVEVAGVDISVLPAVFPIVT